MVPTGDEKMGRERYFIKIFVGADPGGRYGESITPNLQRSMSYKQGKSAFQVSFYLFLILVLDLITLQFSSLVFEGMGMVITNFYITTLIWLNIYMQDERCPITYWLTVLTYFMLLKVFLMKIKIFWVN